MWSRLLRLDAKHESTVPKGCAKREPRDRYSVVNATTSICLRLCVGEPLLISPKINELSCGNSAERLLAATWKLGFRLGD